MSNNVTKQQEKILNDAFTKAKTDADKIWELVNEDIKEQEALLNLQGQPAIYKNTIVLLQGKTGTHKSRLAGSLASLLVSANPSLELFGFSKVTLDECIVIYADTERNISNQLPIALKQILRDSKLDLDTLKNRFIVFPLMTASRTLRTALLGKQFSTLRKEKAQEHHKPVIIFLDIVSDLVADFNNVVNTLELTDLINGAINMFDITFIVTIHENPGMNEKARGHLGTELSNKASTILQMAGTSKQDVFSLKMVKSRTTEKYKEVLLQFDKSVNTLVVVSDIETILQVSDPDIIKLCNVLGKKQFSKMSRKDLLAYIEKELFWKERKIEEKLKKMIDNVIEFETPLGNTTLSKTRGKTAEYKMLFLDLPPSNTDTEEDENPA